MELNKGLEGFIVFERILSAAKSRLGLGRMAVNLTGRGRPVRIASSN
jgi:hypothetical protein